MNEELTPINKVSLILSTNRALIGEIRPKMRKVSIDYDEISKTVSLYIYYDELLTEDEKDYDISGNIMTEIISSYAQAIDLSWDEHEIIIPYPARLPSIGYCVYRRYEESSE